MRRIKVLEESSFTPSGDGKAVLEVDGKKSELELAKPYYSGFTFNFKRLNPIQTAFAEFYQGGNALVASPTSSGKSALISMFFTRLPRGRLIYAAPTKALIGEKKKELESQFGRVALKTGDFMEEMREVKERVVLTTYESLLFACRGKVNWFEDADRVVFDEIHFLMDERGLVLEEVIACCLYEGVEILGLSATIPRAERLAEYLECELFLESLWRPVPLQRNFFTVGELIKALEEELGQNTQGKERVSKYHFIGNSFRKKGDKTLYFLPKKALGWDILGRHAEGGDEILNETVPFEPAPSNRNTAAFHCADVPLEERASIEKEFKEGKLSLLYATPTLAYGVNLPADRVVIGVSVVRSPVGKKVELFPDPITILQMEGRAGRFGLSQKGESVVVIENWGALRKDDVIDAIKGFVEESLKGDFRTYLTRLLQEEGGSEEILILILGLILKYGNSWKEVFSHTYVSKIRGISSSLKKQDVERTLTNAGLLDEEGALTKIGRLLAFSNIPPTSYNEFARRLEVLLKTIEIKKDTENDTVPWAAVVYPLLKRKLGVDGLDKMIPELPYHLGAAKSELEEAFGDGARFMERDGTLLFCFYASGGFFGIPRAKHLPAQFAGMRAEAVSLARFLAEGALRGLFPLTLERIYRISAMVSWGVPLSGTLFPSIEGLGWIRANALEMARKHAEIRKGRSFSEEEFIKEVVSHERENFEVLLEVYSARYGDERFAGNRDAAQSIRKAKFREIDQILKYLQDVSFPLGEPGILRFIASPILGYTKAAITSKKKAWGIIRSAISAKHR